MATAESAEGLTTDLTEVMKEAEEVLKNRGNHFGDKADAMRSRLNAALESARATCQRLEEKTKATAKATDRVIREHPYESIGVAIGLGILIGVLAARK
jgi:ElaB/YqjD/DUF883 family membrane-anchored ribosome-binding protein